MTYEQTREQFLLAWNSNAYLNMCESDDMHNAIVALEKQIPKKPKRVDKNYVFDGNWKKICPCCGTTLMERITTKDESYPVHYNMTKHCKCGQALDWSDT